MRFELQLLGDAMVAHARETHRPEEEPEIEYLSRDLPLRRETAPVGWWRSIGAAMSVVKANAIEGFASSAVALHPDLLFAPSAQANDHYRVDDLSAIREVEDRLSMRRAAMHSSASQRREEPPIMNDMVQFEDIGRLERTRTELRGFQSWLLSGVAKLLSRMVVAYQHKRACDELAALDDRMLKDIGVSRQEIRGAVLHGRDR